MIRDWLRDCGQAWAVGAVLALFVAFVAGPAIVPLVVPMSHYYELRSVTIADAPEGVSPKVIIDRTIHRDFRGRYEIDIMRAEGSEFVAWWECGPHESDWRTYRDEASLPDRIDLDWWLGIPPARQCPLPPGTYKLLTTVYAEGPLGAELSVTTESNIFWITQVTK